MRAYLVLLLLTPALVGCIGGDGEDLGEQSIQDALENNGTAERVARFAANGTGLTELPVDEVVGTAEYLLTGHDGAEPSIGITRSGTLFLASGDAILRSQDNGTTWESLRSIGAPVDSPADSVYRSWDPYLWVDPITDRVFADPMFPPLACTELAWSDDDGETWFERPAVCHPPAMDHQKLASGLPGPDAPPVAGMAYPTVVYQCYNQLVETVCAVSYDGGLDWAVHTVAANQQTDGCGGINGVPAVSPDGVVAVPISSGCDTGTVAVSSDSGLTWEVRQVPGDTGYTSTDADAVYTRDGTLYLLYRGDDFIPYLARSTDHGQSWDGPWRVAPPDVQGTVFHVIGAGDDGNLGLAFLGTPDSDAGPDGAPDEARWYLYIATSDNAEAAEPTFTSYQVQPDEDPVQVGSICMSGVACTGGNRNLLDFIDARVAPDGTFYVAYAEGCTDECANKTDPEPSDSRSRETAIAWIEGVSLGTPALWVDQASTNATLPAALDGRVR